MIVRCSNPTCRATAESHGLGYDTRERLIALAVREWGWAVEQQPGDPEPMPYCKRCRET